MHNDGSYIKVRYNVNINDDQIFVVTNDKEVLLTRESAKKMFRILKKFEREKINAYTYIYKDYNKIMKEFKRLRKKRKVNRRKSKRITLGIISGALVVTLVSGVYVHAKSREREDLITSSITFNDDSIEIPEEEILDVIDSSNIDVDVTTSDIGVGNVEMDVEVSTGNEDDLNEVSSDIKIHDFYYDFSGDYDFDTVTNSKQYMELYEKYGNMYGVDPNLLLLIGAQENRGIHSTDTSGPATGLMQIEDWWLGKGFETYNFEICDYERVTVEPEKVTNLEDNIKYGAAMLRYCVDYTEKKVKKGYITENEFLPFAIQTYNMGETNMNDILDAPGYWFDNRSVVGCGDSKYVEHVFCEVSNDVIYKFKTVDGREYNAKIENLNDWIYSQAPSGYGL